MIKKKVKAKLGFGTWGIGGDTGPLSGYGPTIDSESIEMLKYAFSNCIEFFDTAPPYGNGNSENLIRLAFEKCATRPKILTKVGVNTWGEEPNYSPVFIEQSLKNSFERLGISNIYSVIFHSLKTFSIETIEAGFDYLVKCREKGQIEKIGLSLKSPLDLLLCNNIYQNLDIIEVNFNLLDLRVLDSRIQKVINENDIHVVTRTPFAFGFLTEEIDENFHFHDSDHRKRWSSDQIRSWVSGRKELKKIFYRNGFEQPIQVLALAFCMSYDFVNYVIPGMMTKKEVDQNLKAYEIESFSSKLIEELVEYGSNFTLV